MTLERQQRSFVDPVVLAQLGALPLLSRGAMLGNVSGRHTSPHRGASVEFAEYRKYVPGDDLRRLDWRAYGRSDRFYIKEFEADTNLRMVLVVDTSGSMEFGSVGLTKFQYAQRLSAALGYLAIQQGDAVGLTCAAHGIVRQRAFIVVVSDLFVEPENLRECFEHLRFRKHDVTAFHLLDPEELAFDFQRPTRFLDMEGGTAIFADPVEIAERYHAALDMYLTGLRQVMLETAVDYRRISIDSPYPQELTNFLVDRAYHRRAR